MLIPRERRYPVNRTLDQYYYSLSTEDYVTCAFIALVIFIALFGNLMVSYTFIALGRMRRVAHYFTFNLALVSMLAAIVCMPLGFSYILTGWTDVQNDVFNLLRTLVEFIDTVFLVTSSANLVLIGLDRLLCVRSPFGHHRYLTSSNCTWIMACIWLYGVLVASIHWISWNGKFLVILALGLVIPGFVLLVFYGLTLYIITVRRMNLCTHSQYNQECLIASKYAIITGLYLILWTVYIVINGLTTTYEDLVTQAVTRVAMLMLYITACLTPFVFVIKNQGFKTKLNVLICKHQQPVFTGPGSLDYTSVRDPIPSLALRLVDLAAVNWREV